MQNCLPLFLRIRIPSSFRPPPPLRNALPVLSVRWGGGGAAAVRHGPKCPAWQGRPSGIACPGAVHCAGDRSFSGASQMHQDIP